MSIMALATTVLQRLMQMDAGVGSKALGGSIQTTRTSKAVCVQALPISISTKGMALINV